MVKVSEKPKEDGKYAMPLSDYLGRKNHLSKGSWKRPEDKEHQNNKQLKDDFGRFGCKDGVGMFHPEINGRCVYCGLTKGQIKDRQKRRDNERQERKTI